MSEHEKTMLAVKAIRNYAQMQYGWGAKYHPEEREKFDAGYPDLVCVREDGRVLLVECKGADTPMTGAEVLFVMQLVNPCYRIFYDAEQAAKAVME